jgi:DNA polymerase-3 subunit gamma/tau
VIDASPDAPDRDDSGLVGAPLVAQMLGGTVIDEVDED